MDDRSNPLHFFPIDAIPWSAPLPTHKLYGSPDQRRRGMCFNRAIQSKIHFGSHLNAPISFLIYSVRLLPFMTLGLRTGHPMNR